MSILFQPLKIRGSTFKNRIGLSPMCQYSAVDGVPNSWHSNHLGARAIGGFGLVMFEATAVSPEGRISNHDLGLWNSTQAKAFEPIVKFIESQGCIPGIQIAHAGRKASMPAPLESHFSFRELPHQWTPLSPTSVPFSGHSPVPKEMSIEDIKIVAEQFVHSAKLAVDVGFKVIELHAAHGYLLHSFLSPLANSRKDEYGGSFENRIKFILQIVQSLRKKIPADIVLFVRFSAKDWAEGGWNIEDSIRLAKILKLEGVDCIDCSSGAIIPNESIPQDINYQIDLSEKIKFGAQILTAAVGRITQAHQAESLVSEGKADFVMIGREALRNPFWPYSVASELKVDFPYPKQYGWALKRPR